MELRVSYQLLSKLPDNSLLVIFLTLGKPASKPSIVGGQKLVKESCGVWR